MAISETRNDIIKQSILGEQQQAQRLSCQQGVLCHETRQTYAMLIKKGDN